MDLECHHAMLDAEKKQVRQLLYTCNQEQVSTINYTVVQFEIVIYYYHYSFGNASLCRGVGQICLKLFELRCWLLEANWPT
jgi:hypothetical protein